MNIIETTTCTIKTTTQETAEIKLAQEKLSELSESLIRLIKNINNDHYSYLDVSESLGLCPIYTTFDLKKAAFDLNHIINDLISETRAG